MLTEARVDEILKEMDTYVLELASEPSMLGPQYFQDIIAKCRGYLNKVSLIVSEVNRVKLSVSGELRRLEAVYSLDYDGLLANDDRVKTLANIEDRKSTVGFLLRAQRGRINELKDQQHSLDAVGKAVSHRNRELQATMAAIRDQRRLMQTELSTGAFYGDERGVKHRREATGGMGVEDAVSADELEALMLSTDPAPSEAPAATPEPLISATPSEEVPVTVAVTQQSAAPKPVQALPATDDEVLMQRFLEGSAVPAPQDVVVEPKHEDSIPVQPKSDVDEFLSMLDGL